MVLLGRQHESIFKTRRRVPNRVLLGRLLGPDLVRVTADDWLPLSYGVLEMTRSIDAIGFTGPDPERDKVFLIGDSMRLQYVARLMAKAAFDEWKMYKQFTTREGATGVPIPVLADVEAHLLKVLEEHENV